MLLWQHRKAVSQVPAYADLLTRRHAESEYEACMEAPQQENSDDPLDVMLSRSDELHEAFLGILSQPLRRPRQPGDRLTDVALCNLITRERPYMVAHGNSLYVLVAPSGLRAWRWKHHFAVKEKLLPLGSYPEVSLAEARAARDERGKKSWQASTRPRNDETQRWRF